VKKEESNLFCACHLLNCDEGLRAMITGFLVQSIRAMITGFLVQSKWCKTEKKRKQA
jgi:hypothetical protein